MNNVTKIKFYSIRRPEIEFAQFNVNQGFIIPTKLLSLLLLFEVAKIVFSKLLRTIRYGND